MNPVFLRRTSNYEPETMQHRIACGITWGTTTDPRKITVIDFKGLLAVVKWPGDSIGRSAFRAWVPGAIELCWAKLVSTGPAEWTYSKKREIWRAGRAENCDGVATPRVCRELAACCLCDHLRVATNIDTGQISIVVAHELPDGMKPIGTIGHDVFGKLATKGVLIKQGGPKRTSNQEIQKWKLDTSRIDHQ